MKTLIPLTALAALFASSSLFAQTPAFSKPSGYVTTTLKPGFNNVGITLHPSAKTSGDLEVVGTNSVQDTSVGVNFTTSLGTTGPIHILEITSGPALGLVTEINTWTANTITTVDNLSAAGVVAGNTYRIRKAPTLEDIFTTNTVNGSLTAGSATTADIVYVPTGTPGEYKLYFLSTAGGGSFRSVSPAGAAPNIPVVYLDGLFVQRKAAGNKDLVITGEVKTDKVKGNLVTGFNYLGTVYPVGSTLQNSGLEAHVTPGNATSADLIYIPTSTPGSYTVVFRSTAGGGTWRTVSPAAVAPTIEFSGAVFIERKGAATPYSLTPPSTWQVGL